MLDVLSTQLGQLWGLYEAAHFIKDKLLDSWYVLSVLTASETVSDIRSVRAGEI